MDTTNINISICDEIVSPPPYATSINILNDLAL